MSAGADDGVGRTPAGGGPVVPGGRRRGALGFVRIPAPAPGERFGWTFEAGDRLALEFDPDRGDAQRHADRVVFRLDGGEVTLLGPCDSDSLRRVTVRLPNGNTLPLDALLSDDAAVDSLALTLLGDEE